MFTNAEALRRYHNILRQALPKIQDPATDSKVRINYLKVVARAQERMAKVIGLDMYAK